MVLTVLIIIVMLVIGFGLVALWREVGFGQGGGISGEGVDARPSVSGWARGAEPVAAPPPVTEWSRGAEPAAAPPPVTGWRAAEPVAAPPPVAAWPRAAEPVAAPPPPVTPWPFGNLRVGNRYVIPTEETYTGFLAMCADDADALGQLHSAAVVADDWGYPFLVAIAKTGRPNGWIDRLDSLPGNVGQYDIRLDEVQALRPVRLPVIAFLNEGRLLDATATLDSPSSIASSFQHCRFGLTR